MKTILYIVLFSALSIFAFAQNWTDPIQISTLQGVNAYPDFCIDNNGTIHCVWSYKIEDNHRIIYYSKSEDEGQTWSEPENVSQNTHLWMEDPHIVADSENNLHLTYMYNTYAPANTLIVYRKFSDNVWSEMDTVSTGWFGSKYSRLAIDHNDKLYCFWFHDMQNGTTFYRTLENGIWSDIQIPYDNNDNLFLMRCIIDSENRLHCSGYNYLNGQSSYNDRIVYFTYNNYSWSDLVPISYDYYVYTGNDIAVNNSKAQIVWRQAINDSIPPDNASFFSKYENTGWTSPIILAENASEQAIVIDKNNKTHIIHNEKCDAGSRLVHYRFIDNQWLGEIVEEKTFGYCDNKLISTEHFIYLVSSSVYSHFPYNSSIELRKYEIATGIENLLLDIDSYNIYPNPSKANTTISYSLKKAQHTLINIYNLQGELINTITHKKQVPGNYKIIWNGTDKNGKEVNNGMYLIRLQAGRQFITRSVEIIK